MPFINRLFKKSLPAEQDLDEPIDTEYNYKNCVCCSTLVKYPKEVTKFKCYICGTSVVVADVSKSIPQQEFSLKRVLHVLDICRHSSNQECHSYGPVIDYIRDCFSSCEVLNEAKVEDAVKIYNVIMQLPTRKPFYELLICCSKLLKRPGVAFKSVRWVRIIFEIPILKYSLYHGDARIKNFGIIRGEIKGLCYDILKRCIGYMSNMKGTSKFVSQLKRTDKAHFINRVELLNMFITFHLSRTINGMIQNISPGINNNHELNETKEGASTGIRSPALLRPLSHLFPQGSKGSIKLKPSDYSHKWHIRAALKTLGLYWRANQYDSSLFYNSVVDYIDPRGDFDCWIKTKRDICGDIELISFDNSQAFSFCQFPFVLSLGMKVAILEYENRRFMEFKAEEAFIKALDSKRIVDVNLKIRVRRHYITSDSLLEIKTHQTELKKSLKVEFINEPGIDVGGLKKEWFLLLTRDLFSPSHGLFTYVEESRYAWFSINPVTDRDNPPEQLYFLFGVILGLAIYNSTILDLRFPPVLYKKLLDERISTHDFGELYPQVAKNMKHLLTYDKNDFTEIFGLTFETSYNDAFENTHHVLLKPHGDSLPVTQINKEEYVNLWMDYYLNKSIEKQFNAFKKGFKTVMEGNSITLLSAQELEQVVCGSNDRHIDTEQLRSVCKLHGFSPDNKVVGWFWQVFADCSQHQQRKILSFITGSDRIPATGISTLNLKLTREGPDSEKLPLAHTCFNELCLYQYSSKEKLQQKLLLACTESEGYGFR